MLRSSRQSRKDQLISRPIRKSPSSPVPAQRRVGACHPLLLRRVAHPALSVCRGGAETEIRAGAAEQFTEEIPSSPIRVHLRASRSLRRGAESADHQPFPKVGRGRYAPPTTSPSACALILPLPLSRAHEPSSARRLASHGGVVRCAHGRCIDSCATSGISARFSVQSQVQIMPISRTHDPDTKMTAHLGSVHIIS